MTCDLARSILSVYVDGDLPSEEKQEFELHLKKCEGCRSALEGIREILLAAGTLRAVEPSAGFDRSLFLRLREERRKKKPGVLLPGRLTSLRHPSLAWGLAGLGLVMLSGLGYLRLAQRPPTPGSMVRAGGAAEPPPRVSALVRGEPGLNKRPEVGLTSRRPKPKLLRGPVETEPIQVAQTGNDSMRTQVQEVTAVPEQEFPTVEYVLRRTDLSVDSETGRQVRYVLPAHTASSRYVSVGPY